MFMKGAREVEGLGWKQRRANMYEAHTMISAECEISNALHCSKNPFRSRNFPNYFSVPACISVHVCSRLDAAVAVGLIKNITLTLWV